MPGFDGTGPRGEGSMTGGARGFCPHGDSVRGRGFFGAVRRAFGMGRGGNFGRGRGWRNWYRVTGLTAAQRAAAETAGVDVGAKGVGTSASPDIAPEGLEMLKKDAGFLSDCLADIKYRIAELEKKRPSEK